MDADGIVDHLTHLGLDPDQARAYVELLRIGPARASSLAEITGFSRTKSYRVLDGLVDDGLAEAKASRPREYVARRPEAVFEMLKAEVREEMAVIDDVRKQLTDPLDELADTEPAARRQPFLHVLEERGRVLDEVQDRVAQAGSSIRFLSTHVSTLSLEPPMVHLWERTAERARDGIDVQGLVRFREEPYRGLRERGLLDDIRARHLAEDKPTRFAIIDDEELIVWISLSDEPEPTSARDIALHTDAPQCVNPHSMLFDRLWEESVPPSRCDLASSTR